MNGDKTREETQSNFSLRSNSSKMNKWTEFDKARDALLNTEAYSASVLASSMSREVGTESLAAQWQDFQNPHHSKELLGIPTSVKIKPQPNHNLRMTDVISNDDYTRFLAHEFDVCLPITVIIFL